MYTYEAAKEVNFVFLNLSCIKQVRLLSYPDSPKNGDFLVGSLEAKQ